MATNRAVSAALHIPQLWGGTLPQGPKFTPLTTNFSWHAEEFCYWFSRFRHAIEQGCPPMPYSLLVILILCMWFCNVFNVSERQSVGCSWTICPFLVNWPSNPKPGWVVCSWVCVNGGYCQHSLCSLCWSRGLQTFLSEGHLSHFTTVQGLDNLRNVIGSWYVTFYQINKFFVDVLVFHYWRNGFAGRIGPRTVVSRPLG